MQRRHLPPPFTDTVIQANNRTWAGVTIVGEIKSGFPTPSLPRLKDAGSLIITAVFITFIGFIESIAVAKAYATKYKCVRRLPLSKPLTVLRSTAYVLHTFSRLSGPLPCQPGYVRATAALLLQ